MRSNPFRSPGDIEAQRGVPRDLSWRPGRAACHARLGRPRSAEVSALLGSSQYRALSDDALKDEDNAAWVLSLPDEAREAWLPRIHWIRLVDRLAENERFEPGARRFARFVEAWRLLREEGTVDPTGPFSRELTGIRNTWLLHRRTPGPPGSTLGGSAQPSCEEPPNPPGEARPLDEDEMAGRSIAAWDAYLEALGDYHGPDVSVRTLHEHDEMLWRLSGRIFQLVPFLTEAVWDAAGEFGRLDQFLNNLRDLQEDADHGICYLPADVLAAFGVSRADVLTGRCIESPRYRSMMHFWLDKHLPTLRARAAGFVDACDLHPSLEIMKTWSIRRHARIERVMRAVEFDFRRFPGRYWAEVRHDLAQHRTASRGRLPSSPSPSSPFGTPQPA
jgi:phytoene synthase